jgi:uncharacterized phage protein gp47/JayE
MAGGLTADGFVRPLQAELAEEILEDERGTISAQLDGSASTFIGNLNNIFADQLGQAWEVLEAAIAGYDPNSATGAALVALCLLTGVIRRGSTKGLVTATVNLDASKSFAAGDLVAHVANEPTNRWLNRDAVVSTTSGNYSAVFESEFAGSGTTAAAGSLTVIAGPVSGWNSITNAADATEGTDIEPEEDLRARRDQSVAQPGSGTVDAIRADVLAVDGVEQCTVEENATDSTVGSLTPHSFRAVIWDGSPAAADDDAIAQAIYDTKPAGIASIGTASGTAVKADSTTTTVSFERATAVPIYVDVDVVSSVGVSAADVKAAVVAAMSDRLVGADVVIKKIEAAVLALDGVDDLDFVQIGTAPSPSGTANISISSTQIATVSTSNIVVTGDAS